MVLQMGKTKQNKQKPSISFSISKKIHSELSEFTCQRLDMQQDPDNAVMPQILQVFAAEEACI